MAVDVRDMRPDDGAQVGSQDTAIARKMMIVVGTAFVILVGIKLGFLSRVLA